jgi:hypothetical protein
MDIFLPFTIDVMKEIRLTIEAALVIFLFVVVSREKPKTHVAQNTTCERLTF